MLLVQEEQEKMEDVVCPDIVPDTRLGSFFNEATVMMGPPGLEDCVRQRLVEMGYVSLSAQLYIAPPKAGEDGKVIPGKNIRHSVKVCDGIVRLWPGLGSTKENQTYREFLDMPKKIFVLEDSQFYLQKPAAGPTLK